MARILIAGCGDVGTRLGLLLAAGGHRVWGLRRQPRHLPGPIRPLAADLTDPESLRRLPADLDAVAYTAAASGRSEESYRRAYVTGVAHLLTALERHERRPRRLVYASSTGVYGQSDGSWVDEASRTEPTSFTGRRVLEGEELCRRSPIPSVTLRLGGIYGPGRTRLLTQVAAGEAVCPEGPPRWTNRIHSDDAAGALAHLLELENPQEVYVGVDCEPADQCRVMRFLAGRLGASPLRMLPAETGVPDRGRGKRCSNRRLLASGYRFLYPTWREGYEELIRGVLEARE